MIAAGHVATVGIHRRRSVAVARTPHGGHSVDPATRMLGRGAEYTANVDDRAAKEHVHINVASMALYNPLPEANVLAQSANSAARRRIDLATTTESKSSTAGMLAATKPYKNAAGARRSYG